MNGASTPSLAQLNETHGIAEEAVFAESHGGLIVLKILNSRAEAEIFLHGAHVTHYKPTGARPVLWLSPETPFARDKAIRGGIPVCFPWFGPHATNDSLPAHGFARVTEWSVESVQSADGERTTVVFRLSSSEDTMAAFPHAFEARLTVVVGAELSISLSTQNTSDASFTYGDALHSYFPVSEISNVTVEGLEGTAYVNRAGEPVQGRLRNEPIRFNGEYDRSFIDTATACELIDSGWNRRIVIAKHGSRSTVVWNPWVEKSARLSGFPDDGWKHMLCIETANSNGCEVSLAAGEAHTTNVTVSVVNG